MPREYKLIVTLSLVPGIRYYIVPKTRLTEKKLIGKAIPEEKADKILLMSGILVSEDHNWAKPIFKDFQKRDGSAHTAPGKPTGQTHSWYSFEPTEVIQTGLQVTEKDVEKTHGVVAEEAVPEEAAASGEAGEARKKSAIKKSTDELVDILFKGPGRHTIETVFERKNPPDVHVTTVFHQYNQAAAYKLSYNEKRLLNNTDYFIYYILPFGFEDESVLTEYGVIDHVNNYPNYQDASKLFYTNFFIDKGANPSKALVTAVANKNINLVKLLLDKGADPNIIKVYTTKSGKRFTRTPVEVLVPSIPIDYKQLATRKWPMMWSYVEKTADELLKERYFKIIDEKLVPTNEADEEGFLVEVNVTKPMIEEMKNKLAKTEAQAIKLEQNITEYSETIKRVIAKFEEKYKIISLRPGGEGAAAAANDFYSAAASAPSVASEAGGSRKVKKSKRKQTRRHK